MVNYPMMYIMDDAHNSRLYLLYGVAAEKQTAWQTLTSENKLRSRFGLRLHGGRAGQTLWLSQFAFRSLPSSTFLTKRYDRIAPGLQY